MVAANLVERYGYLAVFCLLMLGIVGPLIPDEAILVTAGVLAHQGRLDYLGVLAAGYAGSLCGITLSYMFGRQGLFYLFEKVPFFRRQAVHHMPRVHRWFDRYGGWTLFFGYYLAGVRHFTALAAGASRMEVRRFAIYAYTGGLLWVICFVSLGYFLGDQWERLAKTLNRSILAATVVLVIAIAGYIRWRRRQQSGSDEPPP